MNKSFVKMATEMANQALNFDTKEAFLLQISTESLVN
jgi:elongation factor Ts